MRPVGSTVPRSLLAAALLALARACWVRLRHRPVGDPVAAAIHAVRTHLLARGDDPASYTGRSAAAVLDALAAGDVRWVLTPADMRVFFDTWELMRDLATAYPDDTTP